MKKLLIVSAVLALSGCAHVRYYAPVLMENTTGSVDEYGAVYSSGILVKKSTESAKQFANISVKSIHPGFLHRGKGGHWSKREKANAWKDKDLWVFIQVEGLAGSDILEAKVDRKAVFSHVVMNAASYDSLAVDIQPIPIELNKVYRVKAKIYSINKFLMRKAILEAKDKSLGKWVLDSVGGLGKSIGNVFAKEAFDYFKIVTDQNYTFEQFLVTAGSDLEFSGGFDIVPSESAGLEVRRIALYDFIKSEMDPEWKQASEAGFIYLPTGVVGYTSTYRAVKGGVANLKDVIDSSAKDGDLKKSFIKFVIEPTSDSSQLRSF